MTRPRSSWLLPCVVVALSAGCSSSAPPPQDTAAASPSASGTAAPPPGRRVDAATAGTVGGRVVFAGTPPAPAALRMASDPVCVQGAGPNPQSDAILVAADGGVKNAFVWIKDGVDPAYTFDRPADKVQLDQRGCIYAPRVVGLRAGQSLEVVNSDDTFHNVHALPRANQEFNEGQRFKNMRLQKTFTVPEVMVRFKCDVHPWMAAYVGVVAHPFFAVTGADGSFSLAGVPPGTYVVEAWHETFGTQTSQITVGPSATAAVTLTFSAK